MKLTNIGVTIAHTISVAKFEAIRPTISLTAELEFGDNSEQCVAELHELASKLWAKNAIAELAWVAQRRNKEQQHEFNQTILSTRKQIKGMLK